MNAIRKQRMAERDRVSSITVDRKGPVAVLHVVGELDSLTAPLFEEAFGHQIDAGVKCCVVDLSAAFFIDSTGVGVLIRSHQVALEHRGAIIIAGANGMIAQLIKITQLHRILQVFPTIPEAVTEAQYHVRGR